MERRKCSICILFLIDILASYSIVAKELKLNVDFGKPVAVTDEKFLSLTIDPAVLLQGAALSSSFERSVRLANALRPAYVRLGGPHGTFSRSSDGDLPDNGLDKNYALSESDLVIAYQWAEKAGLDVVACISAESTAREHENAEEVVSFSDHMGFNASWQLGYEFQNGINTSATYLAKQLVALKQTLDAFPRYSSSLIIGPDIVDYKTKKQRQYLQEYFNIAAPALSAITWHPQFDNISSDNKGVLIQPDDLDKDKKDLYKVIGRFVGNRPLWIAESKPEEYKNLYLGALILARRLGNAARSNVDVILRQPVDLTRPSPDYWVTLLHKTLVGRRVFGATMQTDEKNHVYLYCQCTKASDRYKQGSITIFGVNINPENMEIKLEGTPMTTVHEYLLSPGFDTTNRMFAESILLNNETLTLLNDSLPEIKPVILNDTEGLGINFPSASIGFWVLPDLKIKSCMQTDESLEKDTIESTIYDRGSIKTHVTRSVQDEEESRDDRRKLRNESRANRRRTDRRQGRPMNDQNSQDQSKLQEHKDRLSKLKQIVRSKATKETVKRALEEIILKATSLISKIQRARSSDKAKEHLKALGLLLTRVPLLELDAAGAGDVQRTKRARRDLFSESFFDRQNVPGEVARLGEVGGLRNSQKVEENIRSKVRASVFDRTSENGENAFYGSHRTNPVDSFPEGDVFYGTEDYNQNPSYLKAVQGPNDRNSEMNGRNQHPVQDYGNVKGSWMDEEGDYGFYEPERYFDNEKRNDRTGPGELWESETYPDKSRGVNNENLRVQSGRQSPSKLTGYYESNVPRNFRNRGSLVQSSIDKPILATGRASWGSNGARFVDRGPMMFDYLDTELPLGSEDPVGRRFKRKGKDLRAILDQEMIDEDDANTKDCNCRVIRHGPCGCRHKRDASNLEIASEEDETTDSRTDDASPGSEEIEVFAELGDEPMEVLALKPDPSKKKIAREIVSLDDEPGPLEDVGGLMLQPELSNLKIAREAEINPLNDEPSSPGDLEVLELQPEDSNLQIQRDVEAYPQSEEHLEIQEPEIVDIDVDNPSLNRELVPAEDLDETRVAETYMQSKEDSDLQETVDDPSLNDEEGSPADLEVLESSPVSTGSLLTQSLDEDSKTAVRRDGSQLFRGESRKTEEEESSIDNHENTAGNNANHERDSASSSTEKLLEKETEEAEASGTEAPSQTFDPVVLSKKIIAEGHEYDYDNDKVARGGSKRQADEDASPTVPEETEEERESPAVGSPRGRKYRPRYSPSRRSKANVATPSEKRVIDRAKALLTLKKIMNERRRRKQADLAGRVGSAGRIREYQNEPERSEKLRKMKERRQRLLQQYRRRALDDEGKRKLNEKIREAIDEDKLPYTLMYKAKRDNKEGEEEKIEEDVPVRPRNVRERIFHPKSRRIYDSDILEHSNPQSLQEKVIRLRDVLENGDAIDANDDADGNDKSYYAMVESLENPRIFHYKPKSWDKEKRSVQVFTYPYFDSNGDLYDLSRYRPRLVDPGIFSDSSEEFGTTSEELTSSKELFVIDPSKYRGGEPTLQVYRRSRNRDLEIMPKDVYEVTWEPILYKLQRARQAEHRKREDKSASSTESTENSGDLLKVVINNLDLPSASELFRILSTENVVNDEKRNAMRSIKGPEIVEIKQNGFEEVLESAEDEKASDEQENEERKENGEDLSMEKEVVSGESNSSENLDETEPVHVRSRRDTNEEQENDYSRLVPSCFLRKSPREIKKNGRSNYLCLKEGPQGDSDEDSSEVFKMMKKTEYYKAVPVKESRNKGYSETGLRRNKNSPELVKILIPSELSDEALSTEAEEDPVVSEKNPRDQNARGSVENNSETGEHGERSDYGEENVSDQVERYNAEERDSEEPEVLMVLPWSQRFGRHRREVNQKKEREEENAKTEKVQQLEKTSSPKVPTTDNFVETKATTIRKRPLKKYSPKGSLFNYLTGKKNPRKDLKEDRGLPSFIEGSIPRMEIVVVDGLKKAQNVTGSVERLIDDLDDRFNETMSDEDRRGSADDESIGITQRAFRTAITNVQKFFTILTGITHALRG
ncbi:uncharacterized protein LOC116431589 isoform X1 [Nomia melanderi]|uniref:uncharacterized protein LOC116431589 isoform X1 n=1 Tax=Nomia melanderi TaxID=2448451 RepID=UPI003FCCE108